MADGDLFFDEDGYGEPTLWEANGEFPVPLLRLCDVPSRGRERVWGLLEEAVSRG